MKGICAQFRITAKFYHGGQRMITNENDNFINRRASFWDNWKHDLSSAIKSFEAQSSEKFVNDDDKQYISTVHTLLKMHLLLV